LAAYDSKVECERCGQFGIGFDLATRIESVPDRHLLGGHTRERWEVDGKPVFLQDSNLETILADCPRSPREKADKLLLAIQRKTTFFGEKCPWRPDRDYPLAYAQNGTEFYACLRYLQERGFIRPIKLDPPDKVVWTEMTAGGYEAIESRLLSPTITVFISSTCYDLLDLRAELADFLESKGFIVKVSDDPYRFDVEPTKDSIQSCLRNVETADVVVCVLDRRYGPLLPPHNEPSATHAEVNHARGFGKPVYSFGRDRALLAFDQLKNDPNAKSRWVEERGDNLAKWMAFVEELRDL
jgi:nucleoside 2-deoxyribosyltransferase